MDKNKAVDLLMDEVSLYDKEKHILYVPDVANEGHCHGIQEFHINLSDERLEEEIQKHGGLTAMCLGCIPAPGAMQDYNDEYGYSVLVGEEIDPKAYGIDDVDSLQMTDYLNDVRNAYGRFVADLDLQNLTVDPMDYKNITGKEWIDEKAREQPENSMTEEQLQHKLYDIYQLDWMMFRGHSLSEIIKGMSEVARESGNEYITVYDEDRYTGEAHLEEDAVDCMYAQWEKDSGFKGEIFACFEEFCENEYLDASYMHELMNSQPIELTGKLEDLYDEFMMAREEREMQEEKDRYFPPDIMGEEVFQYISDVLEKEKKVIGDRAEAADRYDAEDDYSPRTLEDAIKTFTPVTGADMLEVLKDESKMDNEKQKAPFADTVLDGALKYDTKLHRREAYNKVKDWMGKPCDKVAKEIKKLQEKNRAQGR